MRNVHLANAIVVTALSALSVASVSFLLRDPTPPPAPAVDGVVDENAYPAEVVGLWTRWPAGRSDGDRVRFYFFHEKGIGLYRYGRIGLNTTSSFDWRVDNGELVMTFRKTGEVKRTPYELAAGEHKMRSLILAKDPKEPLAATVSYTYVPPSALAQLAPDFVDEVDDEVDAEVDGSAPPRAPPSGVGGRMWIDEVTFATGGKQFAIYQLKDTAIDGRGVGWHHVGDYDDWSTEALSYRYTASSCKREASFDVHFNVRDESFSTPVLRGKGGGLHEEREDLILIEDPRSFWHVRRYKDGGRSFQAATGLTK